MTASESSADGSALAPTVSKVTIFPPMCTMPVFRRRPSLRPPSTPVSSGLRRSNTFGVLGDDRYSVLFLRSAEFSMINSRRFRSFVLNLDNILVSATTYFHCRVFRQFFLYAVVPPYMYVIMWSIEYILWNTCVT